MSGAPYNYDYILKYIIIGDQVNQRKIAFNHLHVFICTTKSLTFRNSRLFVIEILENFWKFTWMNFPIRVNLRTYALVYGPKIWIISRGDTLVLISDVFFYLKTDLN